MHKYTSAQPYHPGSYQQYMVADTCPGDVLVHMYVWTVMAIPWSWCNLYTPCFWPSLDINLHGMQIQCYWIHLPIHIPWKNGCAVRNHSFHIWNVELLVKAVWKNPPQQVLTVPFQSGLTSLEQLSMVAVWLCTWICCS